MYGQSDSDIDEIFETNKNQKKQKKICKSKLNGERNAQNKTEIEQRIEMKKKQQQHIGYISPYLPFMCTAKEEKKRMHQDTRKSGTCT